MRHLFIVLACVLAGSPAFAAATCGATKPMLDALKQQYGEDPAFFMMADKVIGIITTNAATGTWTFIVQPKPGVSCTIAAGDDWTAVPADAPTPNLGPPT